MIERSTNHIYSWVHVRINKTTKTDPYTYKRIKQIMCIIEIIKKEVKHRYVGRYFSVCLSGYIIVNHITPKLFKLPSDSTHLKTPLHEGLFRNVNG